MTNYKGYERNYYSQLYMHLPQDLLEGTWCNHKKYRNNLFPIHDTRFKPGTSSARSRNADDYTAIQTRYKYI
jgi:hypothetical protein